MLNVRIGFKGNSVGCKDIGCDGKGMVVRVRVLG